ncbi:MAG: D-alanine--D-alanine ligase [Candidatus Wallbacteria bacterium]|nr:D-alanine--D-alanine ligase [Candidatus Wallbacteria bacterium]
MSRKLRVGIIYGGRSGEHLVSVASATSLVDSLDRSKYEVVPIAISREGRWLVAAEPARFLEAGVTVAALPAAPAAPDESPLPVAAADKSVVLADVVGDSLDVAIPLVHGTYGEDGTLQGLLEMAGVPYVGAGVLASAVGMDKIVMKKLLAASGLPVVDWLGFRKTELETEAAVRAAVEAIASKLGMPCFVKPANGGSSVGMTKVKDPESLPRALQAALAYDTRVIVERGIACREIECSVIGNAQPEVSVPGEITYTSEFYDYETKYTPGRMELVAPAKVDADTTSRIRALAGEAYRALECEGMARLDMFIEKPSGKIFVNEINTIPGFTATSVFAKLWEASGVGYAALLDKLIGLALDRYRERRDLAGLR